MSQGLTVVRDGIALNGVAHVVYDVEETRVSRMTWPDFYYRLLRELLTTLFMTRSLGINESLWEQPATRQLRRDLSAVLRPISLPTTRLEDDILDENIRQGIKTHLGMLSDSVRVFQESWKQLVVTDFESYVAGDACFDDPPKDATEVVFTKKRYLKDSELLDLVPEEVVTTCVQWVVGKYPRYGRQRHRDVVAEFVKRLIPTHVAIAWQYQRSCELQEAPTDYFPSGPRAKLVERSRHKFPPESIRQYVTPYLLDRFLMRFDGKTTEEISSDFFPMLVEFCLAPEGDLEVAARQYADRFLNMRDDPGAWQKEASRLENEVKRLRPDRWVDLTVEIPVYFFGDRSGAGARLDFRVPLPLSGKVKKAVTKKLNSLWWIQQSGGGHQPNDVGKAVRVRLSKMFPNSFGKWSQ